MLHSSVVTVLPFVSLKHLCYRTNQHFSYCGFVDYQEKKAIKLPFSYRYVCSQLTARRRCVCMRLIETDTPPSSRFFYETQKHVGSRIAKLLFLSLVQQNRAAIVLQCMWRQKLARYQYAVYVHPPPPSGYNDSNVLETRFVTGYHQERSCCPDLTRAFRSYWSRLQRVIDVLDIIAVQS
jgi:hypothetical protein